MSYQIRIFSLITLNAFLLSMLIIQACKKELSLSPLTSTNPSISIEEAKQFFSSKTSSEDTDIVTMRSDTTELPDRTPLVMPDWNNAVSYYDVVKRQSVVEAPLLKDHLSRILVNPDSVVVSATSSLQILQNDRLIIVRDSLGVTDYAIMKIAGSYHYNLSHSEASISTNTYKSIDSLFEGAVHYVDVEDHLKLSYYVSNGRYYKIDSTSTNGLNPTGGTQDRWEIICIRVYEDVPCPCNPHHSVSEIGECKCSAGRPHVLEYLQCYETPGPSGNHGGTPPFYPNPQWGNGGTVGNPNSNSPNEAICFSKKVLRFDSIFGISLLNEYEDVAFACNNGCSGSHNEFEKCVLETILKSYYPTPPEGKGPILDIKASLDSCFGNDCADCTYSATIFIEQPVPGTRELWSFLSGGGSSSYSSVLNNGHTFLELSQTTSSGITTTKGIGFYPLEWPTGNNYVNGYFYNENNNTRYNIKVKYEVNETQFTKIRNQLNNIYYLFNAGTNNCTTAAVAVLNAAGLNIPLTPRQHWPIGNILGNPADLGEDLRANPHGGQFSSTTTVQRFTPSNCQK